MGSLRVILLLALALVASACVPAKKALPQASAGPLIVKEYQIEAHQFGFTPNEIRVPLGAPVRLVVRSQDVDHQLAIVGISPTKNTVRGRVQTMDLVAVRQGVYDFVCAINCGTGHDRMKGTLIVE